MEVRAQVKVCASNVHASPWDSLRTRVFIGIVAVDFRAAAGADASGNVADNGRVSADVNVNVLALVFVLYWSCS